VGHGSSWSHAGLTARGSRPQCLVFLNNRLRAGELVGTLGQHGYPAAAIAGDMPQVTNRPCCSHTAFQ
jgi:superfamily II DNA/RNA helicase